jgi:hypothetical protein
MRLTGYSGILARQAASLALIALLVGCHDSSGGPTAPAINPTPNPIPPTPTPLPAASNITGNWTGTFDSNDEADCYTHVPATGAFSQNGSKISGSVTATQSCDLGGSFEGTLQGNSLTGTLVKDVGWGGGHVFGLVSTSGISLNIADLTQTVPGGTAVIPGGGMELHR